MSDPRFFNDVEGLPWRDVLRLKEDKLLAQLRYVSEHSELYGKKFAEAHVDVSRIKRLDDVRDLPFTEKMKGINVFPSAVQDVVPRVTPRTTGGLRIVADFPGHTTQRPLRICVEYGQALAGRPEAIEQLRLEVAERLCGLLNFAPAVEMVAPNTFEKPGIHKVALIVRET